MWDEETKKKAVFDLSNIRLRNLQVAIAKAAEEGAEPGSDEQLVFLQEAEKISYQAIAGYFTALATFFGDDAFEMDCSEIYARSTVNLDKYCRGELPLPKEDTKPKLTLVP